MNPSELVFAYGSNMDPAQMRERCPESDLAWFVGEARGWRLCFPRESEKRRGGVGSIVRSENDSVWGVIFAVTKRDLTRLDSYEGVPSGAYKRDYIDIVNSQGKNVSAWTYFAVPDRNQEFTPHKDYIMLYIRGAEYFGLPAGYIEKLRTIKNSGRTI
jgi:cation transport regulator ChaC